MADVAPMCRLWRRLAEAAVTEVCLWDRELYITSTAAACGRGNLAQLGPALASTSPANVFSLREVTFFTDLKSLLLNPPRATDADINAITAST
eukprot:SM000016S01968  [mRNA]  locus=s16:985357:985950:- [translate_table: standard]